MPTILLVRHGQGSFGGADYDVLSALGTEQAAVAAAELRDRSAAIERIVTGDLRRQRETATPSAAALGLAPVIDPRWDEYRMDEILAAHSASAVRMSRTPGDARPPISSEEFQTLLEDALADWIAAGPASAAPETWPAFDDRVDAALSELAGTLSPGRTAVAFTSGGVIGALCARLLGLGPEAMLTFNRVAVNGAITKVVTGRRGATLVSFNEHAHLERTGRSLITYR